ncbi:Hypothetical protein KFL_000030600 [Klebsormidium nitens]|uniref:Lycopene beta-cyclase n=1 Tax=Klebsormidium nitens TaxID=105231 RepID=A0A1Y1HH77_KLENI|nr:Hypothetical protein KFL_000030600 [Klebsormidium nitens]|eukprot:GAQ77784.1 Hypothetical protein KFL_000030600 [Klebsormidium nitens]
MGVHKIPEQPSLSCGQRGSPRRSTGPRSAASIVSEPAPPAPEDLDSQSLTQRIMEATEGRDSQTGGAGGAVSYAALKRADQNWARIRTMKTGREAGPAPETVKERRGSWRDVGTSGQENLGVYDVVVCGGTLGVFLATALQLRGKRVAIVERGVLMGRAQEWNISKQEMQSLVEMGVLTQEEVEDSISIEFNPGRCGFYNGTQILVNDVLNLGVSPAKLIESAKRRFVERGGVLLEKTGLENVDVFADGAVLNLGEKKLVAKLVIDAMGHASPIVRQLRWGRKPDGVCLVVGACARGFPEETNTGGDVILTNAPATRKGRSPLQYFWEAFPAGSGPGDRTTYMFTYLDAHPDRPSLESLLEDYWQLMPKYQGVKLENLEFLRVLFGCFPTYRSSPLQPGFDRVLQIGDASGIQSPLSFGGFGAITRHIGRLTDGISDALDADLLKKRDLALLNPYQPNLSGAWLLQKSMSYEVGSNPPPNFINELLSVNFGCMQRLGEPILRPFLQDVTQFVPLALTMGAMMVTRPLLLPTILRQVGLIPLVDWLRHFVGLAVYSLAHKLFAPLVRWLLPRLSLAQRYRWKRRLEAWEYGSGLDYRLH